MSVRALLVLGIGAAAILAARNAGALALPGFSQDAIDYDPGSVEASGGNLDLDPAPALLESLGDAAGFAFDQATAAIGAGSRWQRAAELPENYAYIAAMHDAESANGIPFNLQVRQAWEESRFNPNAYNASGASGIMQIVPRWHPNVNPWDPWQAIPYAAGYLARLYARFGTWELALKAYNWGEGYVAQWLAGKRRQPAETERYSRVIIADLATTGTVIV